MTGVFVSVNSRLIPRAPKGENTMRPSPLRINRTPARMRANNYFLRRSITQKTSENATFEAHSLPKLDKTYKKIEL